MNATISIRFNYLLINNLVFFKYYKDIRRIGFLKKSYFIEKHGSASMLKNAFKVSTSLF